MTYEKVLAEGERLLLAGGVEEGRLDAWYLFSHCFSMDRGAYLVKAGNRLLQEDRKAEATFWRLIEKRRQRIPLQQLLGSQEFMGFEFFVNEHVLVPRQDTETLVETVLSGEKMRVMEKHPYKVLDLCTGSGCIGLSLALCFQERPAVKQDAGGGKGCRLPDMEIVLSDISEEALQVAEENIGRLQCKTVCRAVQSDLFEAFEGTRFDCIVSNPPYIPSGEIEGLSPEVKDHEPRLALDGSPDGLEFYRRIGAEASEYLVAGGRLYLEIGWDQGAAVPEILYTAGFTGIEVLQDLAGKNRVVKAVLPGFELGK